jgi:hypothetical protein
MKTTDLRNIMSMAWRFAKTTGENFADCLRQAWQNFKLVAAMRARIVRFYYRKVDGSIREAWGTLHADLIPPTTGGDRKRNDTVQTYFDTERGEYRSFKRFNLVSIN